MNNRNKNIITKQSGKKRKRPQDDDNINEAIQSPIPLKLPPMPMVLTTSKNDNDIFGLTSIIINIKTRIILNQNN